MSMKVRVKTVKDKYHICYLVQVKHFLFWKTLFRTTNLNDAKNEIENLKIIDKLNHPKNEEVTFFGWMVRNQYEITGISRVLDIYSEFPTYKKSDDEKSIYWGGKTIATLNTEKSLFGEMGLEPRKVKITIEAL